MNRKRIALLVIVPAILMIVLLLVVVLPSHLRARKQSQQLNACLNNQRMITAVIESYVVEQGLYEGDSISPFPTEYFPRQVFPKCPSGGKYVIPSVGRYPYCTYHGHLIDETEPWGKWLGGKARKRPVEVKKIEISKPTNALYSLPAAGLAPSTPTLAR